MNNPIIEQLKLVSTISGNLFLVTFTFLIISSYLIYKHFRSETIFFFATALSYPLSIILKNIFKLSRPPNVTVPIYFKQDLYGFPSSHVMFYTVIWGFLIYLSSKLKHVDKLLAGITKWLGIYLLTFIGISRIALGVHYLKDVIGGYIFGLTYLIIIIKIYEIRKKKQQLGDDRKLKEK